MTKTECTHILANREMLTTARHPRDFLVGQQARPGVRHALQALILAQGGNHQPQRSTQELLDQANPGHQLSISPRLLDQYPSLDDHIPDKGTPKQTIQNPITTIPDHIFMITADISMLLELAEQHIMLIATE